MTTSLYCSRKDVAENISVIFDVMAKEKKQKDKCLVEGLRQLVNAYSRYHVESVGLDLFYAIRLPLNTEAMTRNLFTLVTTQLDEFRQYKEKFDEDYSKKRDISSQSLELRKAASKIRNIEEAVSSFES